jgi:hypothetical protein
MTTIALFGAAGKMGTRIADRLRADADSHTLYVEAGEAGQARLRDRGLVPTTQEEAVWKAGVAVLAVPDTVIGRLAGEIVPRLQSRAMVICLDPAAPFAGELPQREDVSYFVAHPCHPSVVSDEADPQARTDFFGGVRARQNIVCALMQGPEEDYARGEQICRKMFAPVIKAHRVTVEQMAILEPAMAETVILTCMYTIREAVEEAVRHGVPPEAARDFALGHINVDIGILFGYVDAQVSDGAKLAVQRAKERILQAGWKAVFEPEDVQRQVRAITRGAQGTS